MFKHLFRAQEGELIEIQSEWVFGGDLRYGTIPEALLHPQFSLDQVANESLLGCCRPGKSCTVALNHTSP